MTVITEEAPAFLAAMLRSVTTYTEPTQDTLSERPAVMMNLVAAVTMAVTMAVAMSAMTTVTTMLDKLGQFSDRSVVVQNERTWWGWP
jgi:hypothetical protein